jgi:hypothetical protein
MQPSPASAVAPVRLGKPDGVSAAVWIVIGISALMAFNALGLLAGGGAAEKMQALFTPRMDGRVPQPDLERFQANQRNILAAARPVDAVPVGAVALATAIAGIICAIRLNQGRRNAVAWFSHVTIAICAIEVITIVQGIQIQRRMQPFMTQLMNDIPRGPHPAQSAPIVNMMTKAISGMTVMAMVMAVGFGLAKIGVCLYARLCARKPAVAAWIGPR